MALTVVSSGLNANFDGQFVFKALNGLRAADAMQLLYSTVFHGIHYSVSTAQRSVNRNKLLEITGYHTNVLSTNFVYYLE
jgi:hypothetical protein